MNPHAGSTDTPDWSKLPAPEDDGGAQHLLHAQMPSIALISTDETKIDLSKLRGRTLV
jgi:peroxiredoxin (alkyl hydroperoxide reductase subunit C)